MRNRPDPQKQNTNSEQKTPDGEMIIDLMDNLDRVNISEDERRKVLLNLLTESRGDNELFLQVLMTGIISKVIDTFDKKYKAPDINKVDDGGTEKTKTTEDTTPGLDTERDRRIDAGLNQYVKELGLSNQARILSDYLIEFFFWATAAQTKDELDYYINKINEISKHNEIKDQRLAIFLNNAIHLFKQARIEVFSLRSNLRASMDDAANVVFEMANPALNAAALGGGAAVMAAAQMINWAGRAKLAKDMVDISRTESALVRGVKAVFKTFVVDPFVAANNFAKSYPKTSAAGFLLVAGLVTLAFLAYPLTIAVTVIGIAYGTVSVIRKLYEINENRKEYNKRIQTADLRTNKVIKELADAKESPLKAVKPEFGVGSAPSVIGSAPNAPTPPMDVPKSKQKLDVQNGEQSFEFKPAGALANSINPALQTPMTNQNTFFSHGASLPAGVEGAHSLNDKSFEKVDPTKNKEVDKTKTNGFQPK